MLQDVVVSQKSSAWTFSVENMCVHSAKNWLSRNLKLLWLQSVALCCSVLQCAAVCCSVLQCVALSRNCKLL